MEAFVSFIVKFAIIFVNVVTTFKVIASGLLARDDAFELNTIGQIVSKAMLLLFGGIPLWIIAIIAFLIRKITDSD